ncbi:HNH endonuclease [Nocardiopsis dassonvillei]|uniref:HNH endonuclease n=1 Tax=Nocardiopsis dassonvillei TaxID=2014 RepID=UPI0035577C11
MSVINSISDQMWTKKCSRCARVLPVWEFYMLTGDRVRSECKDCHDWDTKRTASNFEFRYKRFHGTDPVRSELVPLAVLMKLYPRCNQCTGEWRTGREPSLDHVIPVSDLRSSHRLDNLQLLCTPCQRAKFTHPQSEAAMRTLEAVAGVRRCVQCGRSRVLAEFHRKGKNRDGSTIHHTSCKSCVNGRE